MIDYEKLKKQIEYALDCCKTIKGERALGAEFAYENVLLWMDEFKVIVNE